MEELMRAVSALVDKEYEWAANSHGGVAASPHEGYALIKEEVDADDIAVDEHAIRRKTVYNGFVDLDAQCGRKAFIAQAGRLATIVHDEFTGNGVELACGNTRCYPLGYFAKCLAGEF